MSLDNIGNAVTIRFEDGETVKGWLYGEVPQGVLIALDQSPVFATDKAE